MSLSYGYEPEPWMNSESHNRHSSRKKIKRERNKKLRRIPINKDIKSMLKRFDDGNGKNAALVQRLVYQLAMLKMSVRFRYAAQKTMAI